MRIGLQIPNFTYPGGPAQLGAKLVEMAQAAEGAGFYSLWVMDHFFQLEPSLGPADNDMLEGYSTLAYLAAVTERIKLGTLVTGVIYRYPGILVKTASTLDVLSGGRSYFGVGAAWYEREAAGLGVPFPPLKERFEWLEETLQIARQMWADGEKRYEGRHFKLAEALNRPQPLSKPHPPIMVGGMGERRTLRLVAQYADACNLFARVGIDEVRRKLDVLKYHCDDLGRDYDEIERTTLDTAHLGPGARTPADVIAQCRALADIGVQHAIFNMPSNAHEITPLEIFGREIIPEVAEF